MFVLQIAELTDEQKEYIAKVAADKEAATAEDVEVQGPTSFFHGKADKDYQVLDQCLIDWSVVLTGSIALGILWPFTTSIQN